jgi:hypothetical protein
VLSETSTKSTGAEGCPPLELILEGSDGLLA